MDVFDGSGLLCDLVNDGAGLFFSYDSDEGHGCLLVGLPCDLDGGYEALAVGCTYGLELLLECSTYFEDEVVQGLVAFSCDSDCVAFGFSYVDGLPYGEGVAFGFSYVDGLLYDFVYECVCFGFSYADDSLYGEGVAFGFSYVVGLLYGFADVGVAFGVSYVDDSLYGEGVAFGFSYVDGLLYGFAEEEAPLYVAGDGDI